MTQTELRVRRENLMAKVRRRRVIKNILLGAILVAGAYIFMDMFITAWDEEIQLHGEYNRQYIESMEEGRD